MHSAAALVSVGATAVLFAGCNAIAGIDEPIDRATEDAATADGRADARDGEGTDESDASPSAADATSGDQASRESGDDLGEAPGDDVGDERRIEPDATFDAFEASIADTRDACSGVCSPTDPPQKQDCGECGQQTRSCGADCQWGAYGTCSDPCPDPCRNTPYGGWFCGQSTEGGFANGRPDYLYFCDKQKTVMRAFCATGCVVESYGTNDHCK
jgi:hypothetical protein